MKLNKILTALTLSILTQNFFALPFNMKLSNEDLQKIHNEEVLIKSIDKCKNMALQSDNPGAVKLQQIINELNPNYLAEIIQVRKIEGNEDLPEKLQAVLEDVEHYSGIPYWSVQHKCYFDLYGITLIENTEQVNENKKIIHSIIDIRPFGFTRVPLTFEKTDDYFLYTMSNDMKLAHKGITCVKPDNMLSIILLFKDGDNWVLYGLGGVKAPKVAGFERRIETAFINRAKTFCQYVYSKVQEK